MDQTNLFLFLCQNGKIYSFICVSDNIFSKGKKGSKEPKVPRSSWMTCIWKEIVKAKTTSILNRRGYMGKKTMQKYVLCI